MQVMTDLLQLWNDRDVLKPQAKSSRNKDVEKRAGEEIRDAAMRSLVDRRTLSDVSAVPGATAREKGMQRKR